MQEADRVLARKAPENRGLFKLLLDRAEIGPASEEAAVEVAEASDV